jgi:predicted deacylase
VSAEKVRTIGVIRDCKEKEPETIAAPADGMILHLASAPPVNAGESVATVATAGK